MQDQASHAVLDVRESERMVIFGRGKPTKFKCFYRTLLVRFYEFDLSEENIQSMIDEQNAHLNQKGFRYDVRQEKVQEECTRAAAIGFIKDRTIDSPDKRMFTYPIEALSVEGLADEFVFGGVVCKDLGLKLQFAKDGIGLSHPGGMAGQQ